MAQPVIDTILEEIAKEIGKLPAFLGPSFAKYEDEVNRIVDAFNKIDAAGSEVAQGGLSTLKVALTKLENIKYGDDVKKIALVMEEAGEKADKTAEKITAAENKKQATYEKEITKEREVYEKEQAAKLKQASTGGGVAPAATRLATLALGPEAGLALAGLTEAAKGLQGVFGDIGTVIKGSLSNAFSTATQVINIGAQAFGAAFSASSDILAAGISQLTAPMSALSHGIGAVTGALIGPFQQLASAIGPFVGALNPALMAQLSYAFRNLQATIGVALVPVAQMLVNVFREIAVTIYPAMKALAPILANVINVLKGVFIPVLGVITDLFVALSPVIEFITGIFSSIADGLRVFLTVIRTVAQTIFQMIASLFGGVDLKDIGKQFREVLQQVVKNFVMLAAYLGKFLNSLGVQNNFVENLQKNLKGLKGEGEQAVAAPQNVGIKGFEQIGKDIALAAFAAQAGGEPQKETNDFLKDIEKMIEDIKAGKQKAPEWVNNILKFITDLEPLIAYWKKKIQQGAELAEEGQRAVAGAVRAVTGKDDTERAGGGASVIATVLGHIPRPSF